METSQGTLLGGRVAYAQPLAGFRSGIEPVLLAASIPARAGQTILEAGSGAGAGSLCLAARVPGISAEGWEQDAELAALARVNLAANGLSGLSFIAGDIQAIRGPARFDHAFANPPYHREDGTPSPDVGRAAAKVAPEGMFVAWIAAMSRVLRPRGTLTLSVPIAVVPNCVAGFTSAGCGSVALLPLWPRAGRPAKLGLLRAIRGGRGPFRLLTGLALHDGGKFSIPAEAILRRGDALLFE